MAASFRTPTPSMRAAMKLALWLERCCGEAWVRGRYRRTAVAIHRRGWADTYQITPGGQIFYLLNDTGRKKLIT